MSRRNVLVVDFVAAMVFAGCAASPPAATEYQTVIAYGATEGYLYGVTVAVTVDGVERTFELSDDDYGWKQGFKWWQKEFEVKDSISIHVVSHGSTLYPDYEYLPDGEVTDVPKWYGMAHCSLLDANHQYSKESPSAMLDEDTFQISEDGTVEDGPNVADCTYSRKKSAS